MAITHVVSSEAGGASTATTGNLDTSGGTLAVMAITETTGSVTPSDNKGNTWTLISSLQQATSLAWTYYYYSILTSVGANHTFSAATSSGVPGLAVSVFAGTKASAPLQSGGGSPTIADFDGSGSTYPVGSITPSEDGEVLVAIAGATGSPTLDSIDLGYTIGGRINAGAFSGAGTAYLIQTTAAAKNPSWTWSTTQFAIVGHAAFKAAPEAVRPLAWPNPMRRREPSHLHKTEQGLNLALYFPAPVPDIATYGWHWPNPVLRVNAPAWQRSVTQGLVIPRDADYFYGLVWVSIAGVRRAQGRTADGSIDFDSLTIHDVLGETPSTCSFIARGFTPLVGQEVIVTLGSATTQNPERIFAGTILNVVPFYEGGPLNQSFQVNCIDWTWQLNKQKVIKQYTSERATNIACDLIATYAPGFTAGHVAGGLDTISVITFTNQDLTAALTQLAKRIGAIWYVDYRKDLHFYITEPGSDPVALTSSHPSLTRFHSRSDIGPWITRAFSEGGGGNALASVAVGETILPVDDASWYEEIGGIVAVGSQRATYAGRTLGGGGGLVGPGASPTTAPVGVLAAGAGVETGSHDYAATFVTAAGESIAGPVATVAVGTIAAPTGTPTPGSPTVGTSLNVTDGDHQYGVTFVTAAGETTAGPLSAIVTTGPVTGTEVTDPATGPTVGAEGTGGALNTGVHDYVVTFVNAAGETEPSPVSDSLLVGYAAPTVPATLANGPGAHFPSTYPPYTLTVSYTFMYGAVESLPSPSANVALDGTSKWWVTIPTGGAGVTSRRVYFSGEVFAAGQRVTDPGDNTTTDFTDHPWDGDAAGSPPVADPSVASIALSDIPTSAQSITSRKLYRRFNGIGTFKLVDTIAGNVTTTYTDTTANSGLGADAPSTNTTTATTYYSVVPLTAVPIGGALVTARKIYRTAAGGSQLKLVDTIANNTATTYSDTLRDGLLGADAPTVNTATANQVSLSSIQVGGATVTSRKVYRTVAGGAQLKLLATIADNVTTTYTDSTADASLGANVPTGDTSGLTQPAGQVAAGSTSLIMAGTGAFASGGGWAVIGNGQQVIRYTGVTASALTGVPASGDGAIVASIGYNSTVTEAPQLTGIPASGDGSIVYAIVKGDPVNLLVQEDDIAGQDLLSELLDPLDVLEGAAGIKEDYRADGRIASTEARARAAARLTLAGGIVVSISYQVRDPLQKSGRNQAVNLPAPQSLTGDFLIQSVTITKFSASEDLFPTYTCEASSERVSFEQLLASMRGSN